ncbi:hypothetical protein HYG89_14335 [Acinetobacter sp. SwsAc5]|uniref:hypothetical protein n=1 Tax=Acinetobacter sp. SwsAc5 TaxID=2749438 RepID=UPI0015B7B965|nr:hypothetical protein [Acinetobacter sp. SwsAc5]NWK53702.1 hypothetical protein [Acinetobacter sp. SwsAc5]
MSNTIVVTTYNESLKFTGCLLGTAEGKPYPDCDSYVNGILKLTPFTLQMAK